MARKVFENYLGDVGYFWEIGGMKEGSNVFGKP